MTHVFIFAGQSNMAGADAPPDPVQPCLDLVDLGLQTSADKAALLTYAAGIEPTSPVSMPWGDVRGHCGAVGGQIQDPEGKSYKVIGPEVGFVRHLAEWNHPPVAIIKATANFQSLYDERSPWLTEGPLGSKWRTFVAESLSSLATIAPDHKIAGIVWFQGIDDALLSRPRVEYQRDLAAIIAATQTPKHPNTQTPIPFVITQSVASEIAGRQRMRPILEAQQALAAQPCCALADTSDLAFTRGHHLTAASQLIVGTRIADAYLRCCFPK